MPLFKQRGIKAVKMDDIAAALSISKRTLYEVYDKKEDLLLAGARHDHEELLRHIQEYALTAENEIDIVVTFFKLKFADLHGVDVTEYVVPGGIGRIGRLGERKHDMIQERRICQGE